MKSKFDKRGVALVVLTVMVLIIGLLIYIVLEQVKVDIKTTKVKNTKDKFKEIRRSIGEFVLRNGRFPCPASFEDVPESITFGQERRSGELCDSSVSGIFLNNGVYYGAVPARTLKLSYDIMIDQWGNKIGYAVSDNFTPDNALDTVFKDRNNQQGKVQVDTPGGTVTDVPYVLVSYGPDGAGSYTKDSSISTSSSVTGAGTDQVNRPNDNTGGFVESPGIDDMVEYDQTDDVDKMGEEAEIEYCSALEGDPDSGGTGIKLTLEGSGPTVLFEFESVQEGETSYATPACPIVVSTPAQDTDYYYSSTNEFNKIGKLCDKEGVWKSDLIGECVLESKCVRPVTINGRAITWDPGTPANVVLTGVINGTFDVGGGTIELQCLKNELDSLDFYVKVGEVDYQCTSSSLADDSIPEIAGLNATWDTGTTYVQNDIVTATGCETGYNENPSGAARVTCIEGGWDVTSVTNPCILVTCSDQNNVYDINGTQLMNNTLLNTIYYTYSPSSFASVVACKVGEESGGTITGACITENIDGYGVLANDGEYVYCANACSSMTSVTDTKKFVCNAGKWEYQQNACTYASATIANGSFTDPGQTAVREGTQLAGTCDTGYTGTISTTCQSNGTWLNSGSCAIKTCNENTSDVWDNADSIAGGSLYGHYYGGTYPSGIYETLYCAVGSPGATCSALGPGFDIDYQETVYCGKDCSHVSSGNWSFYCDLDGGGTPVWKMNKNSCIFNPSANYVTFPNHPQGEDWMEGTNVVGTCSSGYSSGDCGVSVTATCQSNGTWSYNKSCLRNCSGSSTFYAGLCWDADSQCGGSLGECKCGHKCGLFDIYWDWKTVTTANRIITSGSGCHGSYYEKTFRNTKDACCCSYRYFYLYARVRCYNGSWTLATTDTKFTGGVISLWDACYNHGGWWRCPDSDCVGGPPSSC